MTLNTLLLSSAVLAAPLSPPPTHVDAATYRYAITSPQFGAIGTYVRSSDGADGHDRSQSQLRIVVRVLGIAVFHEQADETEAWQDGHLVSFESRSTTNAKTMFVHGELRGGRLAVTTPHGTTLAPVGTVAADPWASRQLGAATVVTLKTGDIVRINTTGGETERLVVNGISTPTRHFRVSTASQPNWWEIWVDSRGTPVKLRSLEHGRTVEFTLKNSPVSGGSKGPASRR